MHLQRDAYVVTESSAASSRQRAGHQTEEVDLRDVLDLLVSGRNTIALVTAVIFGLTLMFAATSRPTFEARGSLQAEAPLTDAGAFSEAQATLGVASAGKSTSAQMQLLSSKRVLDPVIDELALDIRVRASYFPLFGEYIARAYKPESAGDIAEAWPGFSRWAWGGEKLEIEGMTVRPRDLGTQYTLVAGEGGNFTLTDTWGGVLATGRVGQEVKAASLGLTLVVKSLSARPGAHFLIRKVPRGEVIDDLRQRLVVDELGIKSGVIGISFRSDDPEEAAAFVDALMAAFIEDNRVRQVSVTNDIRGYLERQLPLLKQRLGLATKKLADYESQFGSPDMEKETVLLLQQSMKFKSKRLDFEAQLKKARATLGPRSPRVLELIGALEAVDQEETRLKARLDAFPTQNRDLQILKREARNLVELNDVVQTTINSYLVAEAGSVANVRVVDRGNTKDLPVSFEPWTLLVLSLPLGFVVGAVVVLLRRAMLAGIDNPSDVEFLTGLPTALVPFDAPRRKVEAQFVREEGRIPSALRIFAASQPLDGITMLCGPVGGVGKAFVMANLGAVLARAGRRVVMVDADLRGGNVHRYFEDSLSPGLSEYVTGSEDVAAIVRNTDVPGLDFISSGEKQDGSVSIIRHPRFPELLQSLARSYEVVLVAAPGVLARPDAMEIGRIASRTILVMRAAQHRAGDIVNAVDRLGAQGIKVDAGILNRVGETLGSYGYRGYRVARYA